MTESSETETATRRRPPQRRRGSIGGGNPLADDAEHTEAVSPLAGATWTPTTPAANLEPVKDTVLDGVVLPAGDLPEPVGPETEDDTLTDAEQQRLEACEAVIDQNRHAWWKDGKALSVVARGKLYRRDYPSLEAYLEDRWEISRPVAYRRMEMWTLGERLSPLGLNERQARDLWPYASKHGLNASEVVYRAMVEADGVRVTAKLVADAVSVLPDEKLDKKKTAELVREFLAGGARPAIAGPAPVDPAARVEKARMALRRLIKVDEVRAAPRADRTALAGELRNLANELEDVEE